MVMDCKIKHGGEHNPGRMVEDNLSGSDIWYILEGWRGVSPEYWQGKRCLRLNGGAVLGREALKMFQGTEKKPVNMNVMNQMRRKVR